MVNLHWTYSPFKDEDDLEQGDFLAPTPALRKILSDVHPHFCDTKYLGFVIITQSCDLVRRGSATKANYIGVATVRALGQVMPKLVAQVTAPVVQGVFRQSGRQATRDMLKRVFDQNEQKLGLFYLHPDAALGLGEHCVAFLRVSVALRAEHYQVLLDARKGRLAAEFRSKFGWLVGNLYSRAASPDWADQSEGQQQLDALINLYMTERLPDQGPIWVDDETVDAAAKAKVGLSGLDRQALLATLEDHRPQPNLSRVTDEVMTTLAKVLDPQLRKVNLLKKIPDTIVAEFPDLFEADDRKTLTTAVAKATLGPLHQQEASLRSLLPTLLDDAPEPDASAGERQRRSPEKLNEARLRLQELQNQANTVTGLTEDESNMIRNRLSNNALLRKIIK